MIEFHIEGLERLEADLARIVPETRARIVGGALRSAAEAVAEEGNRRVHSPRGRARTFKVFVHNDRAFVSPGSRANFFAQRFMPILQATINATHDRIERILVAAVEAGVRAALR